VAPNDHGLRGHQLKLYKQPRHFAEIYFCKEFLTTGSDFRSTLWRRPVNSFKKRLDDFFTDMDNSKAEA